MTVDLKRTLAFIFAASAKGNDRSTLENESLSWDPGRVVRYPDTIPVLEFCPDRR